MKGRGSFLQQPLDCIKLKPERENEAGNDRQAWPGDDEFVWQAFHPGSYLKHIILIEYDPQAMPLDQGRGALDIVHLKGKANRLANQPCRSYHALARWWSVATSAAVAPLCNRARSTSANR